VVNFILVHSTGGNPDETFFPWLRKEIEKRGHKVYTPFFPTPIDQKLDKWLEEFKPYLKYVNKNTIFVGRSIAPAFILRVLERIDVKVKAAFMVAGFCSDIGLYEFRTLIDTFVDPKFKWKRIQGNCEQFFVYNSENDPLVPVENAKELAKNLYSPVIWVKGAGHFIFKKFPRLLSDIDTVLGKESLAEKFIKSK
jgi:uncharacterized protein